MKIQLQYLLKYQEDCSFLFEMTNEVTFYLKGDVLKHAEDIARAGGKAQRERCCLVNS